MMVDETDPVHCARTQLTCAEQFTVDEAGSIPTVELRVLMDAYERLAEVRAHYIEQPEEGYHTTMRELLGIKGSTPGSTEAVTSGVLYGVPVYGTIPTELQEEAAREAELLRLMARCEGREVVRFTWNGTSLVSTEDDS